MATASWIHTRFAYSSPKFIPYHTNTPTTTANNNNNARNRSASCSCSSSQRMSFSSGVDSNNWKRYQGRLKAQAMDTANTQGNMASARGTLNGKNEPDHLLVLVHGILASPSDWTYVEAALKKCLGKSFLIYVSSSNTHTKTLVGIDEAGKRLAEEVTEVVKATNSLKRISFLSHSLGGLFARYAIAVLYSQNTQSNDFVDHKLPNSQAASPTVGILNFLTPKQYPKLPISKAASSSRRGTIAGLEPINFITLATPHLGVRGKKQLPLLLGNPILERLIVPVAPLILGETGSQLFLTDDKPDKPPLLLRMASNCEDGQFISALGAFRCRILYANVSYDHMVGWRTSSIRREKELVTPPLGSLDGYEHVVDVEYCPPISPDGSHFPSEAAKAKEAAQTDPNMQNIVEYHEIIEEEMIHGLQQLGWKKVDVSFHSAFLPFFAHNNIHVKNEWLHNAGAGVIAHVADSFKQEEPSSVFTAGF